MEPERAQPQHENEVSPWNWSLIPELIQVHTFKHLDTKRLLLLRTVSRQWNRIASEVLRPRISVHLRAQFNYSKEAKILSKKLNVFVNTHSKSCPFKSFAIHATGEATTKLKAKKVGAFLKDQAQNMAKISIDTWQMPSALFNLFLSTGALTSNPSLTHLNLQNTIRNLPTVAVGDQPLYLPALTHFATYNKVDQENPNGYTAQVINAAPNLTHLSLQWYGINQSLVPSLNFRNIKVLKLRGFTFAASNTDFPQILEKVSQTIQELYTEDYFAKLGSAGIPLLPLLHTLHITLRWRIEPNFDFAHFQSSLRQENLPVLKNVGLMQVNILRDQEAQLIPHDGVRELCIEPNGYHIRHILQNSLTWFRNFRHKFPGINSIDLTWYNYGFLEYDAFDKILENLVTIFPALETLTLRNARLKPIYFSGVESALLELYRQEDWLDLGTIPRKSCIRNLQRLKKLVLGDKDSLTSEMLASIVELPDLEVLEFQWNAQLSLEDLISNLQHLREVSIGNCCKTQFRTSINEIFMRMPNVHCGCRSYKDEIGFFRDDYCENAVVV